MDEQIINKSIALVDGVEGLKLTHNSRGYTWDIKIIGIDVKRIKQIDNEMSKEFSSFKEGLNEDD